MKYPMKQEGEGLNGADINLTAYKGVYDNWDTEGKGSECHPPPQMFTQTNKQFFRRKVHIWFRAKPDDNDLYQLHWMAQVSPL